MNDPKKSHEPLTAHDLTAHEMSRELFLRYSKLTWVPSVSTPPTPADLIPDAMKSVTMPVDRETVIHHLQGDP